MRHKFVYRLFVFTAFLSLLISLGGAAHASAGPAVPANTKGGNFLFEKVMTGFNLPVFITNAGDGTKRIFIVEKPGVIRIYDTLTHTLLTTPFLDISSIVNSDGNEQGLLALAFHPNYGSNGRFFVVYNSANGSLNLVEYAVSSGDANLADDTSGHLLLNIPHPNFDNHNGGTLAFSPVDHYLYWSIGDGGSGGDPNNNAQNTNRFLGKMLRLDVSTPFTYTNPTTNPYYGGGGLPEIWAYGLRNPWRFSFDSLTGDLFIADVGQNAREEVDFQPYTSTGGENYGWRVMEGKACYDPPSGCNKTGKVLPITDYTHAFGCAIVGGYMYRGALFPPMQGYYFYSDECSGIVNVLRHDPIKGWVAIRVADTPYNVSTFGLDENGEIYFADYGAGDIYKICYNTNRSGPVPRFISPRRAPSVPCPAP